MLSSAFSSAYQYTRPIIILKRFDNKTVAAGVGTFFVVNKDGWAITAAHMLTDFVAATQHKVERDTYLSECAQIDANPSLSDGKKRHQKNQLHRNSEWITKMSAWWGANGVITEKEIHFDVQADIAITRLSNIENLNVKEFPRFASPKRILQAGATLCRLGFPFFQISATFNETKDDFEVPPISSITMFPDTGIHTRIRLELMQPNTAQTPPPTQRQVAFIETSSPGLRGQSGGPIFDKEGVIWGVQSKTQSLPLGFNIQYEENGKKKQAPEQFIHVGLGSHISHIRDLFKIHGVTLEECD